MRNQIQEIQTNASVTQRVRWDLFFRAAINLWQSASLISELLAVISSLKDSKQDKRPWKVHQYEQRKISGRGKDQWSLVNVLSFGWKDAAGRKRCLQVISKVVTLINNGSKSFHKQSNRKNIFGSSKNWSVNSSIKNLFLFVCLFYCWL